MILSIHRHPPPLLVRLDHKRRMMRPARLRTWRMYRHPNPNPNLKRHLTLCYLMYISLIMMVMMMVHLFYRWLQRIRTACVTPCN